MCEEAKADGASASGSFTHGVPFASDWGRRRAHCEELWKKIEAGLIERDACSITVPDTRGTLVYLIYPRNFHAALRSAPQAALVISYFLFFCSTNYKCGEFTRSVTNWHDLWCGKWRHACLIKRIGKIMVESLSMFIAPSDLSVFRARQHLFFWEICPPRSAGMHPCPEMRKQFKLREFVSMSPQKMEVSQMISSSWCEEGRH